MPTIVNWRDASPGVGHDNAVVWACLQPVDSTAPSTERGVPRSVLERLDVMTVHGIQGRKDSDHHKHQNREQVYYIIRGNGEAICGGTRCAVEEGDALYLPSGLYHQILNPGEDWLVHHVISMNVAGDGGAFLKSNWRDVAPVCDAMGAIRWHLLGPKGDSEVGALRGLAWIDRESVQPAGRTIERQEPGVEQIYYILEGVGTITIDGQLQSVREGDMIHMPAGATYSFACQSSDWLTYLIVGG